MFESVKTQLWDILKKKQVSLVMIFDRNGDILWAKGRKIEGKSIHLGAGFSRSSAQKVIDRGDIIKKENVQIVVFGDRLPESAVSLNVKTLIILPIKRDFFLYVDSGIKDSFNDTDLEVFRVMGELLGEMIEKFLEDETECEGITGVSPSIKRIKEMVVKYALEDEPVLLIGETGVGKSHIAELIHRYSGRKGKLVVTEITSINEALFESTLFGHKKGSFTDASEDKIGLVQNADKGSLFIDEIFEIPLNSQAKLLRFIDKKKYRPIGEPEEKEADVRIIAATNKNLQEAINNKEFREDLYYRLHVLEIEIPPLRNRKEDIKAFIEKNKHYLKDKELGKDFWEVILNHDWPGNMRELINVLKRAGILLDSPITGDKIKEILSGSSYKKSFAFPENEHWKERIMEDLKKGEDFWDVIKKPFLNRDLNRSQVQAILKDALMQTGGSYKDTLESFNLSSNDYGSFMKFLYRNNLTVKLGNSK